MTSSANPPGSTKEDSVAQARRAAEDVGETVKSSAQDMANTVTGEATRAAHRAQENAADEVRGVASALRTAAEELRSGSPQERTFSQLADGLADASDAMRDKDLSEIMGDLNGFARRNPMVFLGGAALLGFTATRFARASSTGSGGSSSAMSSSGGQPSYGGSPRTGAPVAATPSAAPSSAAFRATDTPTPGTGMPNTKKTGG